MKKTRILITGGAGFIGSHLAESLLADGHKVAIIDNLSTGSWENIAHLAHKPNFSFTIADIRNEIVLDRLASQADVVFHLAAAVGVKLIVEQPVHTIETNIGGTEAVLKAAVRYKCRTFVASTSEVYGKSAKIPYREEDDVTLGATDKFRWAYAASKMVDEFLTLAYVHEYMLPAAVFRFFNTVGPRQTGQYGMVVPRLISQALANEPMTVYGDGSQTRCFCYVGDVVKAIKLLMDEPKALGKVFNIGSTEEISIRGLAERIKKLLVSRSKISLIPYSEAYSPGFEDMMRRVPDAGRLYKLTGWKATTKLNTIISAIASSMKKPKKYASHPV